MRIVHFLATSSVVGASGENLDDMMFQMEEVTEGSASSASHKGLFAGYYFLFVCLY